MYIVMKNSDRVCLTSPHYFVLLDAAVYDCVVDDAGEFRPGKAVEENIFTLRLLR